MDRQNAERITTEYLPAIYGFTIKRCKNLQDAEDLSQDIAIKVFTVLLNHNDITDTDKYIWSIAHNALKNYYRGCNNSFVGVSIDEIEKHNAIYDDLSDDIIKKESIERLKTEIAYLSKLQRRIVIAYYFEHKKQKEIAAELGIPVGTVKWHLFEAKKELRRGVDIMRKSGDLKFNPVKFSDCGTNGYIGDNGANENVLRSALVQNILYSVWKESKTINQIADDLGVSPVFIESEVEFLEKYSYLLKDGDRYLCNILIDEPNEETVMLEKNMYESVADIFANELFDELMKLDLLNCDGILGGYVGIPSLEKESPRDLNLILWALIPYIASFSGSEELKKDVSFEQVATYRADGAHNICWVTVLDETIDKPKYFDEVSNSFGPRLTENDEYKLWQLDTPWSEQRINESNPFDADKALLNLLQKHLDGAELTKEEYAYLIEKGFIKATGTPDNLFKSELSCVYICDAETRKKLIAVGDRIKKKHKDKFAALREPYVKAVLNNTPEQLLEMQKYGLQFAFYGDRRFILHCLMQLVNNGKLKLPTEEQRKALHTLIIKK